MIFTPHRHIQQIKKKRPVIISHVIRAQIISRTLRFVIRATIPRVIKRSVTDQRRVSTFTTSSSETRSESRSKPGQAVVNQAGQAGQVIRTNTSKQVLIYFSLLYFSDTLKW